MLCSIQQLWRFGLILPPQLASKKTRFSSEKGCGTQMSTTPKGPCQSGYYCPNTSAIIPCPPGQFCKWWTKEPKVQHLKLTLHVCRL